MTLKPLLSAAVFMTCIAISVAAHANPQIRMETSRGNFTIELNQKAAPATVANFLEYVKGGAYDNTIFHRVIKNFMVQGGGFTQDMKQKKTQAPIKNEADNGLKNATGTIAMARTSDPNSATTQFFINVKDNTFLDHTSKTNRGWGYCVFGKVIEGMDVVHTIESVPTGTKSGHSDVPMKPVVIKRASLISKSAPAK